MSEHESLEREFERHRPHLVTVAERLLGSRAGAEDAVQESWLRLARAEPGSVVNLGGWLTTVVGRLCLDQLRSGASRREHPSEEISGSGGADPEQEALLADAVGEALLVVLDTLAPAERLAFVLHDLFAVPFEEIASILGRSPDAAKQLASRARGRLRGAPPAAVADVSRKQAVVEAFLTASRSGDFEALLAVLDPGIVLVADTAAVEMGAPQHVRGATEVARVFSGRALEAEAVLVDGGPGIMWAPGGRPKVVWELAIAAGKVLRIDMLAAPDTLRDLDLTEPEPSDLG